MEDRIHIPPRPSRIFFFLTGAFALSIALWALGKHMEFGSAFDGWRMLKNIAASLGVLPGLLAWHVFGRRAYYSVAADEYAPPNGPQTYPSPERFRLLDSRKLPFGAVLERPSAPLGTAFDDGQLLCFRYRDVRSWLRPAMLFHYIATPVLLWEMFRGYIEMCLLGPASWLGIFITFWCLWVDSPWCVISFRRGACYFEQDDLSYANGKPRGPCIVRGVPKDLGLRLTLENGKQCSVYFPGGSLSPEAQQTIALDLFRHHGIPTTEEDNPAAGVYR